jgi:hypothetical protein
MSLFSGKSARLAAMADATQANNTYAGIANALNTGEGFALNTINNAVPSQLTTLQSGRDSALAALRSGTDAAKAGYDKAAGLYDHYIPGAYASWDQMLDAAGVNGGAGNDRARGAFRASPGYQWQVDQALDQTNRSAAASGQLVSGNTLTALQDRANNLADQEYGTYYDRLSGIADRGRSAVDAQAGIYTGKGNLDANLGSGEAGLYNGFGKDAAGVYGNAAASQAGIITNTTQAQAGAMSDLGNRLIGANDAAARAGEKADTNKLNLGIALASMAGNIAGAAFNPAKKV